VETLRKDANLQVLAVTSPGVGDGKTTIAINLAGALAQSPGARVLLVDLDLRRPAVARQLGLGGSKRSLVDALVDPGLRVEDTVERLSRFNLSVLPVGRSVVAAYEVLKSDRLEALLDEARARARALAALPGPAFRDIKLAVRAPVLVAIRALEADDARRWTETAFSPDARARLSEVVSRLRKA